MDIPLKGSQDGFSLPVYGLGTWEVGRRGEADGGHDERGVGAIRQAIERGVTHIDTAESYGAGHCEKLVRQALGAG
jgi:aryl-alcohol dehydrogenase-like predicted oxidoreductase